jgi:hypothetical protein
MDWQQRQHACSAEEPQGQVQRSQPAAGVCGQGAAAPYAVCSWAVVATACGSPCSLLYATVWSP